MYAIQNSTGEYFAGWGFSGSEPGFEPDVKKAHVYDTIDATLIAAQLAQLCQERIERVWI